MPERHVPERHVPESTVFRQLMRDGGLFGHAVLDVSVRPRFVGIKVKLRH
ncbi:hypothetical protein SAMN05892883_1155 [Jatrophihabitans sp. GAS493]|nr:hypothetical protein SAMN05892883_1155 [Jatrophihabitans sp. GAS493]